MNGRYFLDTNIIIYALNNGLLLEKSNYCISFINELELLSFPDLTVAEEKVIRKLIKNFIVIDINEKIKATAIKLRKKYKLKLPDSIICASALLTKAVLLTNDVKLKKIKELTVKTPDQL